MPGTSTRMHVLKRPPEPKASPQPTNVTLLVMMKVRCGSGLLRVDFLPGGVVGLARACSPYPTICVSPARHACAKHAYTVRCTNAIIALEGLGRSHDRCSHASLGESRQD